MLSGDSVRKLCKGICWTGTPSALALSGVKRAYFTNSVSDGLLEATRIFARAAGEAETEFVVNNS
jgi:hypothetical protein